MRYEDVMLVRMVDSGKEDELGNAIYEELASEVKVRSSQWNVEDIELYGRSITSSGKKFYMKPNKFEVKPSDKVKTSTNTYQIESTINLGRWLILITKGHRI